MEFVRRRPGEEMPAPQWHVALCHFLSPSRRYTELVWIAAREFNVHVGTVQLGDRLVTTGSHPATNSAGALRSAANRGSPS